MGMRDNNPNKEKPYGIIKREHILTQGRGLGRFEERNIVTGVESGQSTAYPMRKAVEPTKEEVEKKVMQKIADYEKKNKKKK